MKFAGQVFSVGMQPQLLRHIAPSLEEVVESDKEEAVDQGDDKGFSGHKELQKERQQGLQPPLFTVEQ
jgi:hypothetical protein